MKRAKVREPGEVYVSTWSCQESSGIAYRPEATVAMDVWQPRRSVCGTRLMRLDQALPSDMSPCRCRRLENVATAQNRKHYPPWSLPATWSACCIRPSQPLPPGLIETLVQVRDASRGGLVLAAGVGARPRSQRAVDIFPFIQELQNCRLVVCLVLFNDVPQCDEFPPLALEKTPNQWEEGGGLENVPIAIGCIVCGVAYSEFDSQAGLAIHISAPHRRWHAKLGHGLDCRPY